MALIQVTATELKTKASELENLNSQFKSKVTALETVEENLNSMWEGSANDAFHNAFNNDKQQMGNFSDLITKYVQALIDIAQKYEQAEARNADTALKRNY